MPETRDRRGPEERLTGWGRTQPAWSTVRAPLPGREREAVLASAPRGVLGRGSGRSYGDAAQNSGGDVLRQVSHVHVDAATGTVTASGGATLHEILTASLPLGLCLPVVPGTRHVTVGGAVAADVHGKNHRSCGSLGPHLRQIVLLDGAGRTRVLEPGPELWATVGGMGLTGVVLSATIALTRVGTSLLEVRDVRTSDLAGTLAALERGSADSPYAVAWVDVLARRAGFGRGIVTTARHLAADELPAGTEPLTHRAGTRLAAPPVPVPLVTPRTVRAFTTARWALPTSAKPRMARLGGFLHPLDGLGGWNRLYGPAGFVQHQHVVPLGAERVLEQVCRLLAPLTPFLGVLKRFGEADPAPLSFPRPGWSLAVDLPAGTPGLAAALDRADELVAEAGGAVYLAKDARLRRDLVPVMYPRLAEWRTVRDRLDPDHRFRSDLDRRLDLSGAVDA